MVEEIPLTGYYKSESPPIADILCENLFINYPESPAISKAQLFSTPGIEFILNTGSAEVNRGSDVMDSIPYFVNGNSLYRIDRVFDAFNNPVYSEVNLGVIPGSGPVSIDNNGEQLCIVIPGTNQAYIYSVSGGLVQITDPAFIPSPAASIVNYVVFVDGYFVFAADNSVFFHSNFNDGLAYTATDFGTYDDSRRDIVALWVHREQLYVFGRTTTKAYRNVGGVGFVFAEIPGFALPRGLAARFSLIELDGTFAMIGQGENESPKVYSFTGNGFAPISTTAIDNVLQGYNDVELDSAFSFNYSFRGAVFGGWSLTNNTVVFDAHASRISGQKEWHERRSFNLQDKTRWRANSLLQAYGETFVGDSEGGNIGILNPDVYTDYGEVIRRQFSLQTIENLGKTLFHGTLELLLDNGFGEGEVAMDYTDDGYNYSKLAVKEIGLLGQYGEKVKWWRLGSTNKFRIYRFTMTSPIKWTVIKCLLDLDQ